MGEGVPGLSEMTERRRLYPLYPLPEPLPTTSAQSLKSLVASTPSVPAPNTEYPFFPPGQSWAGKEVLTQDKILRRSIRVPAAELPEKGMEGFLTAQIT